MGRIRWVDCKLTALKNLGSTTAIQEALQDLPEDLEDTYRRVLENVNKYHVKEAKAILQWVTFSFEPVTIEMAPEILAIDVPGYDPENHTHDLEKELNKIVDSTLIVTPGAKAMPVDFRQGQCLSTLN